MNFDYGNILTRAFQVTWKHKVFWGILALPMIFSFALIPFMFAFIFFIDGNKSEALNTALVIIMGCLFIFLSIASMVMFVISSSAVTLGVVRIDRGVGSINFIDLLRDGFAYFWRQLGAILIVQLSIGLVFTVFFGCVLLSSVVTMGIASICFQPIMILLMPLIFLTLGVMEAAQTAVINEDLGSVDAVKRGLAVVREHVWKYVILTLIIYIGMSIVSSVIMIPVFIPVFMIPFLLDSGRELNTQVIPAIAILFSCIFFPLMLIFSSISQTLMKTCLDLTYLRLAQPMENQVISLPEGT